MNDDLLLKELIQQKLEFHWPSPGIDRAAIESMLDDNFWEIGASGKRYNRQHAIETLVERSKTSRKQDDWKTQDFEILEISANSYLLTYTLIQGERITRRATIWRRSEDSWKILYHQGTLVNT